MKYYINFYQKTVELDDRDFEVEFKIFGHDNSYDIEGWAELEIIKIEPVPTQEEESQIWHHINNLPSYDEFEIEF